MGNEEKGKGEKEIKTHTQRQRETQRKDDYVSCPAR